MTTTAKKSVKGKTPTKGGAPKASEAASKAEAARKTDAASALASAGSKAPVIPAVTRAPASKTAKPTVVDGPQPVVLGPVMRKKELIDTVVTRTGIKKKDAKPVIEGMLAVLGEALAEGRELKLPPLGKVVVRRERVLPNGKMMVVKVRQSTPPASAPHKDAAE